MKKLGLVLALGLSFITVAQADPTPPRAWDVKKVTLLANQTQSMTRMLQLDMEQEARTIGGRRWQAAEQMRSFERDFEQYTFELRAAPDSRAGSLREFDLALISYEFTLDLFCSVNWSFRTQRQFERFQERMFELNEYYGNRVMRRPVLGQPCF